MSPPAQRRDAFQKERQAQQAYEDYANDGEHGVVSTPGIAIHDDQSYYASHRHDDDEHQRRLQCFRS